MAASTGGEYRISKLPPAVEAYAPDRPSKYRRVESSPLSVASVASRASGDEFSSARSYRSLSSGEVIGGITEGGASIETLSCRWEIGGL